MRPDGTDDRGPSKSLGRPVVPFSFFFGSRFPYISQPKKGALMIIWFLGTKEPRVVQAFTGPSGVTRATEVFLQGVFPVLSSMKGALKVFQSWPRRELAAFTPRDWRHISA